MVMRQRAVIVEVDGKTVVNTIRPDTGRSSTIQPRIQFDVTVDALGHVTYCDFNISNVTESTANNFFKKGKVLSLAVGYEDNIDYIFSGKVRNVFRRRDGATTVLQVLARGGGIDKKAINISFGKNIPIGDILREIAKTMGYPIVFTASEFSDIFVTGYTTTGDPFMALSKLSSQYDFNWAIEGEKLIVFNQDTGRKTAPISINIRSGLEGIPEVTEVGVDFTVRIEPGIKIGSKVKLDTKYKSFNFSNAYYETPVQEAAGSGVYTIMKIEYSGDNHGSQWSKKCTGYRA